MNFNVDKCKVMHMGKNNLNSSYTVLSSALVVMTQEKVLGVIVGSSLKTVGQCAAATKEINKMLGIKKKIKKQNIKQINPLCAHNLNTA